MLTIVMSNRVMNRPRQNTVMTRTGRTGRLPWIGTPVTVTFGAVGLVEAGVVVWLLVAALPDDRSDMGTSPCTVDVIDERTFSSGHSVGSEVITAEAVRRRA